MNRKLPAERSNAGFTLLEVLVAMTIVGLGVVTLLEVLSQGLRLGSRSSLYTESITAAEQIMDEFLLRKELSDGTVRGNAENQTRWVLEVRRVENPLEPRALSSPWEIKEVTLDFAAGGGVRPASIQLKTLRLVAKN